MAEYEFKVLKIPGYQLEFYSDILGSFGWRTDSLHDVVDSVDSSIIGTTENNGFSFGNANMYYNDFTNSTNIMGGQWNQNKGSQTSKGTTKINTVLSVTYKRDLSNPLRGRLDQLESQCLPHIRAYVDRALHEDVSGDWAEWQAVDRYIKLAANVTASGGGTLSPAKGAFSDIWVEHGLVLNAKPAFRIHYTVNIENRKGLNVQVILHMMDGRGRPLEDKNNDLNDLYGMVGNVYTLKPSGDNNNFTVSQAFPYAELHLGFGKHTIKYQFTLLDISNDSVVAESELREMSYTHRKKSMISSDGYQPIPAMAKFMKDEAQKSSIAPSYTKGKNDHTASVKKQSVIGGIFKVLGQIIVTLLCVTILLLVVYIVSLMLK